MIERVDCLRSASGRWGEEVVLLQTSRRALRPRELGWFRQQYRALQQTCAARRVAILQPDPLSLSLLLFLLDGSCDAMLLIPPETPSERIRDFVERARIDLVLADRPLPELGVRQLHPAILVPSSPPGGVPPEPADDRCRATEWIIPTSGTTRVPRLISHSLASLTRTVSRGREGLAYRWGLLYDLTRFAGLQVFFQSLLTGSTLLLPDAAASIEQRLRMLVEHGCNALSATPTMWRAMLMSSYGKLLPLRQITLGGEIADATLLAALAAAYPGAHVTHIYASTEAGVGFAVHDGREGFPVSYLENAPGKVEIAVDADGHLLLRTEADRQAVLGEQGSLYNDAGWIDTGDRVRREGDRFLFLGRANAAINVGGNKVQPEEVERVIAGVDGVAQVAVRARRSSIVGNLVEAVVVPHPYVRDRAALEQAILRHCREKLPPYKVPALISLRDSLEVSPAGKALRR